MEKSATFQFIESNSPRAHWFSKTVDKLGVDYARQKRAQKRGGGETLLALDDSVSFSSSREIDLIILDEALESLAKFDPTQEKIVALRFFGGLTIEETAHALEISPTTVRREWTAAKAWLYRRMKDEQ